MEGIVLDNLDCLIAQHVSLGHGFLSELRMNGLCNDGGELDKRLLRLALVCNVVQCASTLVH